MSNLRFRLVLAALVVASPAVALAGDDLAADFVDAMAPDTGSSASTVRAVVAFAPASTRMSGADRHRIRRMAQTWALGSPQTVIEVHGYSDSLDLALAQRRAELVRGYLIESGIAPARVIAVGHALDSGGPRIDVSFRRCATDQCAAAVATSGVEHMDQVVPVLRLAPLDRTIVATPTLSSSAADKADVSETTNRISLRQSKRTRARALAAAPAPAPAFASAEIDMTPYTLDTATPDSKDVVFRRLIEFAPASARVYSADRALITRMAKAWRHAGTQQMITVHGYSESLDLGLAERRAHNIRRYLIEAGVSPSQIAVVGHTLDKQGRRVDLSVSPLAK